ncbi:hypothetical protein ACFLSQ_07560 [Bacteroidota bacterium]
MRIAIINIFISILIFSCVSSRQEGGVTERAFVVGPVTWEYWQANAEWDLYEAFDYEPDKEYINRLKELLYSKDYYFIIFATTYCEDCEENIPKAFKLFELAEIPTERIKLFGLDENLKEPTGEYEKFDIGTTPVIFIQINSEVAGEAGYPYFWLENFIEILENYNDKHK